jgi:hypothetical protein
MAPNPQTPSNVERPDNGVAANRWDDRILALGLFVIAGPRLVLALVTRETFGAEATIAMAAVGLGLLLLATLDAGSGPAR